MTINVEPVESVIRVFRGKDDAANLTPFDATGTLHYHGDVAVAYGFHGKLKARDIFDIYDYCKSVGCRWLLAHRKDGHTIPYGNLMPTGPFSGWWFVDLNNFKK